MTDLKNEVKLGSATLGVARNAVSFEKQIPRGLSSPRNDKQW